MTSGGQCVMTTGTILMLLWSASSWDMHTLEVSESILCYTIFTTVFACSAVAYSHAFFGVGTGPIYLDDVGCSSSSASQLLECPSRPILTHDCLHSADAGVGCEGKFFQVYFKQSIE